MHWDTYRLRRKVFDRYVFALKQDKVREREKSERGDGNVEKRVAEENRGESDSQRSDPTSA